MNRLEDELHDLKVLIVATEKYLERDDISEEQKDFAQRYRDGLVQRRDGLLSEKFRGGII